MQTWAKKRVRELEDENLHGFIFKSRSPSSGMERVKVYDNDGVARNLAIYSSNSLMDSNSITISALVSDPQKFGFFHKN